MAAPAAQTTDVASVLVDLVAGVEGLRAYPMILDKIRPPALVVGLPDLIFNDPSAGYCRATWLFPITIIVSRNNDQAAQTELGRLLLDVATALQVDTSAVFSVEPLDARPTTVTIGDQVLPGYLMNVRVRA